MQEEEKLKIEFEYNQHIAYYSSILQTWQNTKMELDKSILTLSSGAIGLLVTFINIFGVHTQIQKTLYFLAIGGFLIAIICALTIFYRNAYYLRQILKNPNQTNDKLLNFLDKILILSFLSGVIFTITLSTFSIENQKKDKNMSNKKEMTYGSVNDMGEFNPNRDVVGMFFKTPEELKEHRRKELDFMLAVSPSKELQEYMDKYNSLHKKNLSKSNTEKEC